MKPNAAALSVFPDSHQNNEQRAWGARFNDHPIDLVHLTRQTFGDKRLETELLRLFMRQSDQIEKSFAIAGAEEAHAMSSIELLHMLSGSARAIGATDVAAMAGGFELRLRRSGEPQLDPEDRQALSDIVARTNRYIAELLDQA